MPPKSCLVGVVELAVGGDISLVLGRGVVGVGGWSDKARPTLTVWKTDTVAIAGDDQALKEK